MKKRTKKITIPRVRWLVNRSAAKAGLAPGSLVHVGERYSEAVRIRCMDYTPDELDERELGDVAECFHCLKRRSVSWINIDGLHDISVIKKLGEHYGLHELILEDILNTEQRPMASEYDDLVFVVCKMLRMNRETGQLEVEQVSLVLGDSFLVTFQERRGDVFDAVRERIRTKAGRVRQLGADYLMFCLLDAIVDGYYGVLEIVGERIENAEDSVMEKPDPDTLKTFHALRRRLLRVRRSVWPMREVGSFLSRGECKRLSDATSHYYRDLYDHTVQVIDAVEVFREMLSSLHDTYLSVASNRMNEIMKVLTIFASIFIPLTFFAGIYGMNFEYMPELKWRYGYFAVWGVMILLGGGMLVLFRRRKWL